MKHNLIVGRIFLIYISICQHLCNKVSLNKLKRSKSFSTPWNIVAFEVCQYNLHFKTLYPGTIDVSILMRNKSPSTDENLEKVWLRSWRMKQSRLTLCNTLYVSFTIVSIIFKVLGQQFSNQQFTFIIDKFNLKCRFNCFDLSSLILINYHMKIK